MFRFNIRDMLWLTALVGLALLWRQGNQARQSNLDVLKRSEAVADEAALEGLWEVMKITSSGQTEDFDGKFAGQMAFRDGWLSEYGPNGNCKELGQSEIVRPGELNIEPMGGSVVTKWRYRLKGGKLWMVRSKKPGDRPSDFDATNDPDLTLHVLKKSELEPQPPAQRPQPADTGTDI